MEDPVFKLSGIVKTREDMEDFEGPLALILQLLSKHKIEIKDVSISLILDQYVSYLDEMAAMDLNIASEFVAMASYLVYIKTKTLLAGDEEISELEELKSSLEKLARREVYSKIKAVTDSFSDMYKRGGGLMVKPPEYLAPSKEYKYSHDKQDLIDAFMSAMSREIDKRGVIDITALPIPKKQIYSASVKARELVETLKNSGVMYVYDLFLACKSRSEMVATFIAVLELCKQGSVMLAGSEDEQTICYTGVGIGEITDDYGVDSNGNA